MINVLVLLKIMFLIIGVVLILTGFYLGIIKVYPSRNYSYISEKKRREQSIKSAFGATIFIFGFFVTVITFNSQEINLNTLISISKLMLCFAPITAGLVFSQTYRYLRAFTKGKDDVVFLDKDNQE